MVDPLSVAVTGARLLTLALVHAERVLVVTAQLRRALARVAVHNEARLAQAREAYNAIRQTHKNTCSLQRYTKHTTNTCSPQRPLTQLR